MENNVVVSIICNTYNHSEYIRDALESFVGQKTDFAYEILVHDDASTDDTTNIIREYEQKYPEIIKPIYQSVNQYSQKIPIGVNYQFPRAKGKYIAFCEGDDYWTDPLKLQKQVDALETHPEVDMCAHSASKVDAATKREIGLVMPSEVDTVFTADKVILGGGGFVATNTLMYRRELHDNPPAFRRELYLDYTIQILGSLRGGMLYLADNMSAYRVMANGSWTSRIRKNKVAYVEHHKKVLKMLELLDEETFGKYSDAISIHRRELNFKFYRDMQENKILLSREYKREFKKLSFTDRIKIRIKAYFPFLVKK